MKFVLLIFLFSFLILCIAYMIAFFHFIYYMPALLGYNFEQWTEKVGPLQNHLKSYHKKKKKKASPNSSFPKSLLHDYHNCTVAGTKEPSVTTCSDFRVCPENRL